MKFDYLYILKHAWYYILGLLSLALIYYNVWNLLIIVPLLMVYIVNHYTRGSELQLYSVKTIENFKKSSSRQLPKEIAQNLQFYEPIIHYIKNFLAKSHPELGRTGPVCPFVPRSLVTDKIKLKVIRNTSDMSQVSILINKTLAEFIKEANKLNNIDRIHLTYVLIFPDIKAEDAAFIDILQDRAKKDFVKNGFMIGEFHKNNNTPGLRNPNFYPLRTPIPCLAIRHMVVSDILFLANEKYPSSIQKDYLKSFLERFGHLDNKEVTLAKDKIKESIH